MKKLAALALATALLASPALAAEGAEPEVSAPAAVLMEKRTGTVLFASGEDERRAPASVTKVMALLLAAEAVERGNIALEDAVTASQRAQSMGGSQIWLEAGEEMSVSELIKCVAVVSANDCAVALAEHIAGSEAAFVERINARAAELVASGIDCAGINRRLFETRTLDQLRAVSAGISNLHLFADGRVAVILFPYALKAALNLRDEHLETLVDVARSLEGVEVAVSIRQPSTEAVFRVSMRSAGSCNVAAICAQFGGGGHEKAAGCTISARDADEAMEKIVEQIGLSALN